ncbi:MAG: hydrogenase 2 operon protein HybA [Chloroflexota bacterium]
MSINRRDFLKVTGVALGSALLPNLAARAAPAAQADESAIGMLYDATICVGCNACTNACRDWNGTAPEPDERGAYDAPRELSADTWTMIQLYQGEGEYSFVKRQCMHCIEPACVSGCPVQALQKTAGGPVTYAPERCIGCRYCMYACPFHIPRFEWDEVIPVVAKCTLCADRLSQGIGGPNCAEWCPTGALVWGKRADLVAEAESRIAAGPDRYVDYVYGKEDAGGTSVLYLSGVSFDKIGFEELGAGPVPELSEGTANIVLPGIILGGPIVLGLIRWVAKRGGWEESWPV